ncbi:MAG: FtsX-like permease family protein [Bacteroidota bacterium]
MIFSLAWRNVWRSRKRSLVVIGAMIVGVWSLIFIISFYNSFYVGFSNNGVQYEYSHLQIHHPDYLTDPNINWRVQDLDQVSARLERMESVAASSYRQKIPGMIASAKTSAGVEIYGVDTEQEAATTLLSTLVVDGAYFEGITRNPILVSRKIANKLKLKIRSKVVLTFQDLDQEITAASFRVAGIFESKSPRINEGVVYVRQSDSERLIGGNGIHEVAILLDDAEDMDEVKHALVGVTPSTVRTYRDIAPEFSLMEQSSATTQRTLTVIIMLALLFGIVNTMLMAVLERTREIGMLRSIGMHRGKVFRMILVETLTLGAIAGPVGLALGYITVQWLGERGLDLSRYSEALQEYGYDAIFYPEIENLTYFGLMITVLITAFVGSIYPAIKAIRINPLEALRKL